MKSQNELVHGRKVASDVCKSGVQFYAKSYAFIQIAPRNVLNVLWLEYFPLASASKNL